VIGSPGVVDPKTGDPRLAINLPDWHEGVLGSLRGALNRPVIIENDVNLAALAERSVGAARDLEDFVLVWIGVGLGMAAFLGGKVHRGAAGAAGEIGYLPVPGAPLQEDVRHPADGGLQSLVGASVVRMLAGVFGFGAPTAGEAVRAAVRAAGEPHPAGGPRAGGHRAAANGRAAQNGSSASGPAARAHEFLGELARRVAIGVASVSVVLDPGLVVLGGDVGLQGGTALADRVAAEVARICPASPRVVPTAVTGAPVLRGAMLAAVDQARTDLLDSV
jgi:predicted NBD/HSP70 family sugar kinase